MSKAIRDIQLKCAHDMDSNERANIKCDEIGVNDFFADEKLNIENYFSRFESFLIKGIHQYLWMHDKIITMCNFSTRVS